MIWMYHPCGVYFMVIIKVNLLYQLSSTGVTEKFSTEPRRDFPLPPNYNIWSNFSAPTHIITKYLL